MAQIRIGIRYIPLVASAGMDETRPCPSRETAQSHCLARGETLYPWRSNLGIQRNAGCARGLEQWRVGEVGGGESTL